MREIASSFNHITPTSIVSYAETKSFVSHYIVAQAKQEEFISKEEFIKYLTHDVNNVIHKDGRIYMQIDNDGLLYANSVSPYANQFLDNIEANIKPLVIALKNKRYLTYSSCEGHGDSFRRYVGLAFADEDSREYVSSYILSLNIKGVSVKHMDSVVNQKIKPSQNSNKKITYIEKFIPDNIDLEQDDNIAKKEETTTFNIQFHRNYDNYCFMEIIILEEIPFGKEFWHTPFRNLWLKFMKRYYWNKLTQQVVDGINEPIFKKYLY